ncbi:uncharacterized protein LOC110015071 [Oryzias latipes]|uniref:uncharacterized protein LOC110015071 n=1 Tax=Oryzias latipes TaxID=8090 RepID=UPI0009DB1884|nr:uncharacterized protein LOC110015071 [Oryzias latipes]
MCVAAAEGPQSFPFVQDPFPDEHVSVEKTDSDEEKPIPAENAAPCPNKPLTTVCHFPEEPALVSSTGMFEANGGVALGESELSERPASAEPNHVASASTQEASEDGKIQINVKFDEPDLDLEEEEDKFPNVFLEINEGKPEEDPDPSEPVIPEEDLTADQDALPIQTEANFVDSENEKVRHMELAAEEESPEKAAKIGPVSTGLEVNAEDQTPGRPLQTEEENQEFDADLSAEVVPLFNVSKAASLEDPSPADVVVKVPMEDADEKEDSVAAKEDSDKESPSTAAADAAASEADSIYVAVQSSNQLHRRDFKAPVSSVRGESQAQVNRGAIIGAALITLVSFILIGFVGIKISKKLR